MTTQAPDQSDTTTTVRLAGALYRSKEREFGLLQCFAKELTAQGWHIGGIVQVSLREDSDCIGGVDAIELDTGLHIPINRPTKSSLENNTCTLDTQALAQTSAAISRAVNQRMDLILVEKYGEQEQQGHGLATDILKAVAEGIPTLVAVPQGVREQWSDFTGNLGDEIPYSLDAFRDWWERVRPTR